jgi:hypothetical protein
LTVEFRLKKLTEICQGLDCIVEILLTLLKFNFDDSRRCRWIIVNVRSLKAAGLLMITKRGISKGFNDTYFILERLLKLQFPAGADVLLLISEFIT